MKISEKLFYLKKIGDLSALLGVESFTYNEGRKKGIEGLRVNNGRDLRATILKDRGLDISSLEYKGYNIGAMTKGGISSPYLLTYTKDGADGFLRQFHAGFLTTCGMSYAGAASEMNGVEYPLHGRVSNSPAEKISIYEDNENDEIIYVIRGEVREARLFAENLILSREIRIHTESNKISLRDNIENLGFKKEPMMMIYHVNFGYPILDAGSKLYFSGSCIKPVTPAAEEGLKNYNIVEEPVDKREEECFYHSKSQDEEKAFTIIHNENLGIAAKVSYNERQCPILCEWKSMQSGDYALGLEPTTSGTLGKKYAFEHDLIKYIEAQESYVIDMEFNFFDKEQEIMQEIICTKEYAGHKV